MKPAFEISRHPDEGRSIPIERLRKLLSASASVCQVFTERPPQGVSNAPGVLWTCCGWLIARDLIVFGPLTRHGSVSEDQMKEGFFVAFGRTTPETPPRINARLVEAVDVEAETTVRVGLARVYPGENQTLPPMLAVEPDVDPSSLHLGASIAILHFPGGRPMQLGLGSVVGAGPVTMTYLAPTAFGSAGAPCFGETGRVEAIHIGKQQVQDVESDEISKWAIRVPHLLSVISDANVALGREILSDQGIRTSNEILARVRTYETNMVRASRSSDDASALRCAASVLWSFDPLQLRPNHGRKNALRTLRLLRGESTLFPSSTGENRWTLKPEARSMGLRELGTLERMREARSANYIPKKRLEPSQRVFDAYLEDPAAVDPLSLNGDELQTLLVVQRWLAPFVQEGPLPTDIRQARRKRGLLEPLHVLVGDHFVGREVPISMVRAYIGLTEAPARGDHGAQNHEEPSSWNPSGPFFIIGPGGVGKSALVAKVILDTLAASDESVPFAFLDFERPGLSSHDPMGILGEIGAQVALQYEKISESYRGFHEALQRLTGSDHQEPPILLDQGCDLLGTLLEAATGRGAEHQPLILVLDSFEEVPSGDPADHASLAELLRRLQQRWKPLRVIVAGRADVQPFALEGRSFKPLYLSNLDDVSSTAYLAARGIHNLDDVDVLKRLADGNPLTLKLGADFVDRYGSAELHGEEGPSQGIRDELVQGMLYRRILDHVSNPDVRQLAHPGLVLRRISPDLITHVLAEPCGLSVPDDASARTIFDQFAKVGSLVRHERSSVLQHRPDVRRVMLGLLEDDRPSAVRSIDEAAVRYFSRLEKPETWQRAEELYHRMRLDQAPKVLDRLWSPELEGQLGPGVLDEVPKRARSWLRGRLGMGGAEPETLFVSDLDRERWAMQQMQVPLGKRDFASAARVADRWIRDSENPEALYLQSLLQIGLEQWEDAIRGVGNALRNTPSEERVLRRRLLLVASEAAENTGNLPEAFFALEAARELMEGEHPLLYLTVAAHQVVCLRYPLVQQADPGSLLSEQNRVLKVIYERLSWVETDVPSEWVKFGQYLACVARPGEEELLQWSVERFGPPRWNATQVRTVVPDLTSVSGESLLNEGFRMFRLGERTEDRDADIRRLILALAGQPRRRWGWLVDMLSKSPSSVVEAIVKLYVTTLRGEIYSTLRAEQFGGEEEL